MKKIIMIGGKAGSGKNSFANILQLKLPNSVIIAFGDYLKTVCTYFGYKKIKDKEDRDILQRVGTDLIRERDPDFWAMVLTNLQCNISTEFDYFIIPDFRFPNEYEYEERIFGHENIITIKIERTNYKSRLTEEQQEHISENALNSFDFNCIIQNDGDVVNLDKKADNFIKEFIEND